MSKTQSNIVPGSVVEPVPSFASLTASRDARTIQATIERVYGFTPTLEYCAALVGFVEDMSDGQQQRPRR